MTRTKTDADRGDDKLPPDAIRPRLIGEPTELPSHDPSPHCSCDLCALVRHTLGTFS